MKIKNQIKKLIREELKKLSLNKTKKSLKKTATELGYLSEAAGNSSFFKTDGDQDKLVDLVRGYVKDPDKAEKIAISFLDDEGAKMPNVDDPGFEDAFMKLLNSIKK